MLKITLINSILCFAIMFFGGKEVFAVSYDFVPNPSNLSNLNHDYYYIWGISWSPASTTEKIMQARISVNNINNWTDQELDNILYVHLLDDTLGNLGRPGVHQGWDDKGNGDPWEGYPDSEQILLTTYTDGYGLPGPSEDFEYSLTQSQILKLNEFASNGFFAFGFDPDCEYLNDGVSLRIETSSASVPEPSTIILVTSGIAGVFFKKKSRSKFQA